MNTPLIVVKMVTRNVKHPFVLDCSFPGTSQIHGKNYGRALDSRKHFYKVTKLCNGKSTKFDLTLMELPK